jgi:hypothetical protein
MTIFTTLAYVVILYLVFGPIYYIVAYLLPAEEPVRRYLVIAVLAILSLLLLGGLFGVVPAWVLHR